MKQAPCGYSLYVLSRLLIYPQITSMGKNCFAGKAMTLGNLFIIIIFIFIVLSLVIEIFIWKYPLLLPPPQHLGMLMAIQSCHMNISLAKKVNSQSPNTVRPKLSRDLKFLPSVVVCFGYAGIDDLHRFWMAENLVFACQVRPDGGEQTKQNRQTKRIIYPRRSRF